MPLDCNAELVAPGPGAGPGASELRCSGNWSVRTIAALERHLAALRWPDGADTVIDGSAITTLDTAGAWLLHRMLAQRAAGGGAVRLAGFRTEFATLLQLLAAREVPLDAPRVPAPPWLERL